MQMHRHNTDACIFTRLVLCVPRHALREAALPPPPPRKSGEYMRFDIWTIIIVNTDDGETVYSSAAWCDAHGVVLMMLSPR